jgi:predicted CXXCH cytochrome family protein
MASPLAGVILRHHGIKVPGILPSDASWSAGPLIPAHQQAAGDRCDHCHKTLFVRIRDTECRECHATTADHAAPVQLAKTHFGEPQRCATCHLEHNESANNIVVRDDTICTACHSRDADAFGSLKVAAVTAFEPKAHPEFKPQLLRPMTAPAGGGIALDWRLESLDREGAHEQSNLKFSHVQHLDATKVTRRTDGNGLGCADCHKLNADGEHFAPITMASSCSSCHELTFDPAAPDRQLPHGKPREVVLTLQEYFARKYSDPAAAPVVRERRRLPGREQEEIKCTGSALECARSTAAQEIETQFAKRGCVSCHAVVDTHSTDIYERYQVYPVRLAADYYPHMHFDHEAHRIQKDKRGDAACLNCHTANKSEESTDLLVPGISTCLECHRSRPHGDQVAVQCVSCHAYHPRKVGSP